MFGRSISIYATLCFIGLFPFCSKNCIGQENNLQNGAFVPKWEVGDWWIVKTVSIADRLEVEGPGPNERPRTRSDHTLLKFYEVLHLFKVDDVLVDDKIESFKVSVRPIGFPKDTADDSGGEPVYQIFVSKSDMTARRIRYKIRGGRYGISGPVVEDGESKIGQSAPVVHRFSFVLSPPFFLPKKPALLTAALSDQSEYLDKVKKIAERARLVEVERSGKSVECVLFTTTQPNEVSYTALEADAPWFVSWRRLKYGDQGSILGQISCDLVAHGKKSDAISVEMNRPPEK